MLRQERKSIAVSFLFFFSSTSDDVLEPIFLNPFTPAPDFLVGRVGGEGWVFLWFVMMKKRIVFFQFFFFKRGE